MTDEQYMQLALTLAKSAKGQTSPNPLVGAVCVKDGRIVGTGAHLKAGEPHAEVHALHQAGEEARGSTVYVTLEPCAHTGKTPPCANLLIERGVQRVVVATVDPNERVSGRGITRMQEAGIDVEVGLCEREARQLNEPFFHYIRTKRPYVTLKAAVTLDGRLATETGDSKWITSPEAREDVHRLRHETDAILVGSGTVRQDNPFLTTRLPLGGTHPTRIILDRRLRTPVDAHVVTDEAVETMIFTTSDAPHPYTSPYVTVERISPDISFLPAVLDALGKRGIVQLFVEGGPRIHEAFIEEQLADEAILYVAPKLIGNGQSLFTSSSTDRPAMSDHVPLTFTDVTRIGPDLRVRARFQKGDD